MGIFGKKHQCSICDNKKAKEVRDGYVCDECWRGCGDFAAPLNTNKKLATVEEVRKRIEQNNNWKQLQKERKERFTPLYTIANKVMIDENEKLWQLMMGLVKSKPWGSIYSFDELESYEIDEDGDVVTKGGLGRAVVGGLAFGGVGAIVGGVTGSKRSKSTCRKLNIYIKVKNLHTKLPIQLITSEVKTSSLLYQNAQNQLNEITSLLDKILESSVVETTKEVKSTQSVDELEKYAKLYEQGILSEEEFKTIKEKIISKM